MIEDMTFLEKFRYRFLRKDPTQCEKNSKYSPLEVAVASGDKKRLDFFAKMKNVKPEQWKKALSCVYDLDAFNHVENILKGKGVELEPSDKKVVASRFAKLMFHSDKRGREGHYYNNYFNKGTVDFMRANGIKLGALKDEQKRSAYDVDYTSDKGVFFDCATPSEIGHELRQKAADLDVDNVKLMLKNPKTNPNAANSQGLTAMKYMAHYVETRNDAEGMEKIGQIVEALYKKGVSLVDADGKSLFSPKAAPMLEKLLPEMVRKNDVDGLNAAASLGVSFKNPKLAMIADDGHPEVLNALALNGADFKDALYEAHHYDTRADDMGNGWTDRIAAMNKALAFAADVKEANKTLSKQSATERMQPMSASVLHEALKRGSQK